jgi:hypothetical protein
MGSIEAGTLWLPVLFMCIAVLVRQFGLRGFGLQSRNIWIVGEVARVLAVGLALWQAGLVGALINVVFGWLILPVVGDLVLFPVLRKGTMTTFGDFRATVPWRLADTSPDQKSLDQIIAEGDKRDREYLLIAQRPAVAKVLADHSKAADDIKRVANDLTLSGLGYRIPRKVVSDPKLLADHYRLEAEGRTNREIAYLYIRQFGHVT